MSVVYNCEDAVQQHKTYIFETFLFYLISMNKFFKYPTSKVSQKVNLPGTVFQQLSENAALAVFSAQFLLVMKTCKNYTDFFFVRHISSIWIDSF